VKARWAWLAVLAVSLSLLGGFASGASGAGYPRPKAAGQLRVSLVPAYTSCAAPNRIHGPPLAFASCSPPVQASAWLTVGTEDANLQPANSEGMIKLQVVPGNPQTTQNEADVKVYVFDTDIRNKSDLSDYVGKIQVSMPLRITDSFNDVSPGGSAREPGTMIDVPFPINAPCATTPTDPSIGSTCVIATTINSLYPGAIKEGYRDVWGFGQTQVYDGGADGDPSTGENTLFQVEGMFVP
jgi:hypothetical protein